MAWGFVQSNSGQTVNLTTLGVGYSSFPTSGTKLIAWVSTDSAGTGDVTSVKDQLGNSFTKFIEVADGAAGAVSMWVLDTPAADVGIATTITVTKTTSTSAVTMLIQEWSGLAPGSTTAICDGAIASSSAHTSGLIGPPTYSDTAVNELLLYAYGDDGSTSNATAPAGYTDDPKGNNGSSNSDIRCAYKNSTSGTETGQWNLAGVQGWALIMVALKLAGTPTTVTATASGTASVQGLDFQVYVIDNGLEAGGASATYGSGTGLPDPPSATLTPNASNSAIIEALLAEGLTTTYTALSNNTLDNNAGDSTNNYAWATGHYTGTVTAGTGVSLGASAPSGPSNNSFLAGYEIEPSGGSAPTLDGSAPPAFIGPTLAPGTGGTSATFIPPPGSVLAVAIVQNGASNSGTLAMAVSSSPALTWTQRAAVKDNNSDGAVYIYTATVPGPATGQNLAQAPQIPPGFGSPMFWANELPWPPQIQLPTPPEFNPPSPPLIPPGFLSPMSIWTVAPPQPVQQVSIVQITLSDVGAEVDDGSGIAVSAAVPVADVGAEVDDSGGIVVTDFTWYLAQAPLIPPGFFSPMAIWTTPPPQPAIGIGYITLGDAAAEVDDSTGIAVSAAVPVADVGAEIDSVSIAATVPLADVAAEVDDAAGIAVSAAVPLADVAAGTDTVYFTDFTWTLAQQPLIPPGLLSPASFQFLLPPGYTVVPGSVSITLFDVGAEVDDAGGISVAATIAVADAGAAIDSPAISAAVPVSDAAGAIDSPQIAAAVPLPDVGAEADDATGITIMATIAVADVAGSPDSLAVAASVVLADAGGAPDSVQISASVPLTDTAAVADTWVAINSTFSITLQSAAGATESWYVVVTGAPDLSEWTASAYRPRWVAQPAGDRWIAEAQQPRWRADAARARWTAQPAGPRWRATLTNFDPISALSPENINVNWDSHFAGLEIDPTGQTVGQSQLAVTIALPVSSLNVLAPAQPVTFYSGNWYTGTNVKGWIAYITVGPGGAVTLTSGTTYDVWSQLHGSPDSPVKFVGQLRVY